LSLFKVQLENAICNRKTIDNYCGGNGTQGKDMLLIVTECVLGD